jgi:phosphopentomutase
MRVILIVLDSVGIGALPDADKYGDEGSDTLGNIAREVGSLRLPNMAALGLGNLVGLAEPRSQLNRPHRRMPGVNTLASWFGFPGIPIKMPSGVCGRLAPRSPGKDTTTGHWEIAGIILEKPFRTYPGGFPEKLISEFEAKIGRAVLGNKPASGTEIIKELGEEHIRTGKPIVYTSADSVFQIAAHEEIVPLDTLYDWCQTARDMLTGDDLVARVIARPFTGEPGNFTRTANRKDYSLKPLAPTLLDYVREAGGCVTAIGKIHDIFAGQGIDRSVHTASNAEAIEAILREMRGDPRPGDCTDSAPLPGEPCPHLIFANLVDFDMLYGHRNDVLGYARALVEFDTALPSILALLQDRDVLVITADHGCDPTTPSTDHSREYVPLLMHGKALKQGVVLQDRDTLADIGATCAELMGVEYAGAGTSFAKQIFFAMNQRVVP